MDLSVVIVNWKVKSLLRRCLGSIYRDPAGMDFEVFVVDNDSRDGSVEMALKEFPKAQIIANTRNLGFSAGNNPAIAASTGDVVLLLNPDTEIVDGALAKMVAYMRANPNVGVCGPKLINADGSLQPSVRRFPTLASQALIMLKLHHALPWLPSLRRYFAEDFDYSKAGRVDQVMGAAFFIRRSVLDAIGGLDERFFIWFEEVDFCKRAADAGFQVWYAPAASVIHHGGRSFGQVLGPKKQRMFNESLRKYFRKHAGLPASLLLAVLHPFSISLAWMSSPARPSAVFASAFRTSMLLIALFEVFSFFGLLLPSFSSAAFIIVVALVAVLAVIDLDLAVLVVLADLFIGSQGGALVAFFGSGVEVPLRLGLFLVVVGVFAARLALSAARRGKSERGRWLDWISALKERKLRWPYVALLAVFGLGIIRGVVLGNDPGDIFFDANGYAYFALFPVFVAAMARPETRARTAALLAAAITASVAKAFLVLYIFSHRMLAAAPSVYVWVRDTRVGEITRTVGDFYRVFFQSHLFALAAMFMLLLYVVYARELRVTRIRAAAALYVWSLAGLLLSLSRSFWFGAGIAGISLLTLFAWGGANRRIWKRAVTMGFAGALAAIAVIFIAYSIPFPRKNAAISFASLLGGRAFSLTGEAAANSRWALLPILMDAGWRHPLLGSGLGATVTYTTSDPRLLSTNPTGEYTTYAFEWGYHDLWVKFGLLGLVVYAWFLAALLMPVITAVRSCRECFRAPDLDEENRKKMTAMLAAGTLLAMIALLATNVFSPYLNHPLGIGLLMLAGAFGANGVFDYDDAGSTLSSIPPSKSG